MNIVLPFAVVVVIVVGTSMIAFAFGYLAGLSVEEYEKENEYSKALDEHRKRYGI